MVKQDAEDMFANKDKASQTFNLMTGSEPATSYTITLLHSYLLIGLNDFWISKPV
jgi:hypothetical protein